MKDISFNCRFNPELKVWILPITRFSKTRIISLVEKYGFSRIEIEQEKNVIYNYSRSKKDYELLERVCNKSNFTYTPRQYQFDSLAYAYERGSFINGDDVGLGKTFESIMYAETSNSFPCLVVTPASVKYNWFEKWAEIVGEKRTISVIESKETKKHKNNWNADVIIINYDIISKKIGKNLGCRFHELIAKEWKMAIFDEAHFLKNSDANRSKIAKKITKPISRIQLLTGTLITSKPIDLWNLLTIIKKDELISSNWKTFIQRYCGGYQSKYGWNTEGATKLTELNEKLRKHCYIRREKRDVIKELPEVVESVIEVPVTNATKIKKARNEFLDFILKEYGSEAANKAMEAEHLVSQNVLRKLSIEGKMKFIESYLKDWKESGIKLAVFGIHKEPLKKLSDKFDCPLIVGGVSSKDKQRIVNEWIESDDTFIFMNIQSAGTGIDGLQKVCSNMIIIELPWLPSDITQVIGRLDRLGQKSKTPVSINYLLNTSVSFDYEMTLIQDAREIISDMTNKGKVKDIGRFAREYVTKQMLRNKKEVEYFSISFLFVYLLKLLI
ncbi:helicase [Tenacibaculum phage Larrie]|nr:helicase [Tenacibaculum phage Larrie]